MENKKGKSKVETAGSLVFVRPLMIGLGLGIYYNQTAVGLLVGLGVGFILFGLIWALMFNEMIINNNCKILYSTSLSS